MTSYVGKFLNCGQVENLVREEKEKRKKSRLNQVKHYSRENSYRILSNVRNERKRQLELIRNRLRDEWQKGKEKKLEELSAEYGRCLRNVGYGHRSALNEITQENTFKKKSSYDFEKALSRGKDALARLSLERSQLHDKLVQKNSSILMARQVEKERAKQIASLPQPTSKHLLNDSVKNPHQEAIQPITEGIDAREAARLEEERISIGKAKHSIEEVEKSIVRAKRYSDARSHFELQKEYNRIMDELEKIVEWEKNNDRKTTKSNVKMQTKEELIAKQEAIVEELFNRLSIPLVSADSSAAFPSGSSETTTDDETPVHHILVSSSTLNEVDAEPIVSPTSTTLDIVDVAVLSVRSAKTSVVVSNETSSSSTTTSSDMTPTRNQQLIEGFSIASNDTILASHPNDFLSNVTIDLSTLPILEESSTKLPPSTLRSTFETTVEGDSEEEESTTLQGDENSDSEEKTLELNVPNSLHETKDYRNVTLLSDKDNYSPSAQSEQKQPRDSPIFRNVAVRRHNLTSDAIRLKETIEKPSQQIDKSSYLRHLLSLAVQNRRRDDVDTNLSDIPTVNASSLAAAGLVDLKASFIQARYSFQAELDAWRLEREQILTKGTMKTVDTLENRIQVPFQAAIPHELSTILEVDTPDSPQQLFKSRVEDNFILTEQGITDEPNLTLVGSDSTSSNTSSEHSFMFGQSFKMFSSLATETNSRIFKTPTTIGTSGSWFDSTRHFSPLPPPEKPMESFIGEPQKQNSDKIFEDIIARSYSSVKTPTISGSSNESWNSCFSKNKTTSLISTPLLKPWENPIPALTSRGLAKFFDTPQQSLESRQQKPNEISFSFLDSIVSSLKTESSETDTVKGYDDCPMCPSSSTSTDTNGSSATFNESLVSFLKHEQSAADTSTILSFSTGLETSSDD